VGMGYGGSYVNKDYQGVQLLGATIEGFSKA